jgi:plastocyanin
VKGQSTSLTSFAFDRAGAPDGRTTFHIDARRFSLKPADASDCAVCALVWLKSPDLLCFKGIPPPTAAGSVLASQYGHAHCLAGALCLGLWAMGRAAATAPRPVTHTIEGMQFRPQTVSVALGDTVVCANKDLVAHTATSDAALVFDSKLIAPDKSWRLTIRTKGVFSYICTYHPTMKGTLGVE